MSVLSKIRTGEQRKNDVPHWPYVNTETSSDIKIIQEAWPRNRKQWVGARTIKEHNGRRRQKTTQNQRPTGKKSRGSELEESWKDCS